MTLLKAEKSILRSLFQHYPHVNVLDHIHLPAKTPMGNLNLKDSTILNRLKYIIQLQEKLMIMHIELTNSMKMEHKPTNLRINYESFLLEQIPLETESTVYHIRKVTDELVSIYDYISDYKNNGKYPEKLKVDCIAKFKIKYKNYFILNKHGWFLNTINDVSNAYKHSFMNSYLNVVGRDYAVVYALGLKENDLVKHKEQFYSVALHDLVQKFYDFIIDIRLEIKNIKNK